MEKDSFDGFTEEEKKELTRMGIPTFVKIGEFEMTEEEERKAKEDLDELIAEYQQGRFGMKKEQNKEEQE